MMQAIFLSPTYFVFEFVDSPLIHLNVFWIFRYHYTRCSWIYRDFSLNHHVLLQNTQAQNIKIMNTKLKNYAQMNARYKNEFTWLFSFVCRMNFFIEL